MTKVGASFWVRLIYCLFKVLLSDKYIQVK
nr:MAG TPA: hypothetical protein [Caudoviricetes sp.]DAZ25180.1 MAG TPA: hypothetical protein [Caudoviricetes sp.]